MLNRRKFLGKTGVIFAGMAMLSSCKQPLADSNVAAESKNVKKNVIWIVGDDIGTGDVGCYGCNDINTPHIDDIAKKGAIFARAYGYPSCSPARAALLTGMYPQKFGVEAALMGEGGMDASATTIAEVFKKSGYKTACIGKWHLGYSGDTLPNAQGFDLFYGHRGGKIDYFKHTDTAQKVKNNPDGKHDFYENEKEIFEEGYSTNLFTNRAIKFIKENSSSPFFMYLAYNAPHYPRGFELQAPGIPHYSVKDVRDGSQPTTREVYAAMVECMDDGIGQILKTLQSMGLSDDTVICFMGDNGADTVYGGSNGSLRGEKKSCWEGGIRIPLIIKWPGLIEKNRKVNCPVQLNDLFPTFVEKMRLQHDVNSQVDGVDISGTFKSDNALAQRTFYRRGGLVIKQQAAIDGKWKMLKIGNEKSLFNLESDPRERHNLLSEHRERFDGMYESYLQWEKTLVTP